MNRGRREVVSEPSFFHFLSILTGLMGCLIIIALSIVQIAVGPAAPEEWLIEGTGPRPTIIEWDGQNIVIHPSQETCTWGAASRNNGDNDTPFGRLVKEIQADRTQRFIFIAVRPSGFGNLKVLLDLLSAKDIRVGYEAIDQDRKLRVGG